MDQNFLAIQPQMGDFLKTIKLLIREDQHILILNNFYCIRIIVFIQID